jgi:hypothetical protein
MRGTKSTFALISMLALLASLSLAQNPTKQNKKQTVAPAAASNPVIGSGTPGQITKWLGVDGSNTYSIGDSNITEDKFGKVGIGTRTPTSSLTVRGSIETTLGGFKFPDGTIQTTAGIPFVIHDASLMGDGRSATPLGIALGGVNTIHLANSAVTGPKIATGTVVRSLNSLSDHVALAGGTNITITPSGNTLTIASPNSLTSVAHNASLAGSGTAASPLGVANQGIGTAELADDAVTVSKVASGQLVTGLNNLTDSVTLAAGPNITITPSGNTLTIAGAAGSSAAYHAVSNVGHSLTAPGKDVISKEVPSGSYIILFKESFTNFDNDPQDLTCALSTGDSSTIRLGSFDDARTGMLVLQDATTLAAATTITVHCTGFNITTSAGFDFDSRIVLTVLKVATIQ